jgi:hypothetical protein
LVAAALEFVEELPIVQVAQKRLDARRDYSTGAATEKCDKTQQNMMHHRDTEVTEDKQGKERSSFFPPAGRCPQAETGL